MNATSVAGILFRTIRTRLECWNDRVVECWDIPTAGQLALFRTSGSRS